MKQKRHPQRPMVAITAWNEYEWLRLEAKRRRTSSAQVARDSFRAYRKLVKAAVALPPSKEPAFSYEPVDF